MNASAITMPVLRGTRRSRSASAALSAIGFSHSTCLPACAAAIGQRHVQMVGQRIVDRLDLGIGEQLLVGAVGLGDAELVGHFARPGSGRARRWRRPRNGADFMMPGMTFCVPILAVEMMPHLTLSAIFASVRSSRAGPAGVADTLRRTRGFAGVRSPANLNRQWTSGTSGNPCSTNSVSRPVRLSRSRKQESMMTIKGSCHCGATRFEIEAAPASVTACTCSFCAKTGALWAYYIPGEVRFAVGSDAVYAPNVNRHHFCPVCGIPTFGESPT